MKRLFLFLIPVVALSATACDPVSPYAAIVNGHTIAASVVTDELKATTGTPKYAQLLDQELSSGTGAAGLQPGGTNSVNSSYSSNIVYNRVLVELIDEEIAKDHITVTDADRTNAKQVALQGVNNDQSLFNSLPTSYQNYLIDRLAKLSAITEFRSTPAKQRAYYNANQAAFATYCIRHILVNTEAQADSLYTQLQGGADFATLAKANSTDTGSATDGGNLGCQTAANVEQFVQPFAQAVLAATPGVVTKPVQSQYGYHLIEVTSKTTQSFSDAQSSIQSTLSSSTDFFTEALTTAKIKVNPRYGEYVAADATTGQAAHIAPHTASVVGGSSATSSSSSSDTSGTEGTTQDTTPDTTPDTTVQ